MSRDDSLSAKDNYISNVAANGINKSKIENYKRIKMEEAEARAILMQPKAENNQYHRRISSNVNSKYKPSANALASYSPLRNMYNEVG